MNDYERIARVIAYLDDHIQDQPSLAQLAREARLSPFHFHRLFSRWAGITPKDFLQCLTLESAKRLLLDGAPVLDAALGAGLSGPGRLHDLCVTLDAASPGEIKSQGRDLAFSAGFAQSPFGPCLIAWHHRGVSHLSFVNPGHPEDAWTSLVAQWPGAKLQRDNKTASDLAAIVFPPSPNPTPPDALRCFVRGTPFQIRVWRALLRVPPGHLVSYQSLAAAIGRHSAARALGSAIGRNPIGFLIPCHRVIRATGAIGNYRWGSLRKRAIIAWETARSRGPTPHHNPALAPTPHPPTLYATRGSA